MAIYACSDLHGRLDLFRKIKEIIKPEDIVYFLGDAGDRGPDGWELIKTIYDDEQFVYLKGNHEDMLVDAIRTYNKNSKYASRAYNLLVKNGGQKTFEDWQKDGCDCAWVNQLSELPLHAEYTNKEGTLVLMSHAGYTPWCDENEPGKILIQDEFDLLWDREHFYDKWSEECFQNCVVVHGHTTIPSLVRRLCDKQENAREGAYWYAETHKVCIDNWSAFSGVACLLNLDTMEDIVVRV